MNLLVSVPIVCGIKLDAKLNFELYIYIYKFFLNVSWEIYYYRLSFSHQIFWFVLILLCDYHITSHSILQQARIFFFFCNATINVLRLDGVFVDLAILGSVFLMLTQLCH